MSNIDGGDLNEVIREFTDIFENLSSQFPDANISFDWDEIKWITNYKSELLLNFTPFMSIGFGAEYLTKTNLGAMSFNYDDSWVGNDPLSAYQDVYEEVDFSANTEHKLTIIPLTASLHLFVPMGNTADFFITGGVGYYLGKLEFTSNIQETEYYTEDYFDSPRIFLYQWLYDASDDSEITYEAKCNTIGYHGGAGLDIKFSPNMSLFIQGNYRYVNLDEWEGDAEFDMSYFEEYGWSDLGITEESDFASGSITGKLWYYESIDDIQDIWLPTIMMAEEEPTVDDYTRNIRPAEILLNGFSIIAGIKITF
jgi:opacity protein-like surface antigen